MPQMLATVLLHLALEIYAFYHLLHTILFRRRDEYLGLDDVT